MNDFPATSSKGRRRVQLVWLIGAVTLFARVASATTGPTFSRYGFSPLELNPICQLALSSRTLTYVGSDAIAGYYRGLATQRRAVERLIDPSANLDLAQDALAANLGPVLPPLVIGAGAYFGAPSLLLIAVALSGPSTLYTTYRANRFRFVRDREAEAFDAKVAQWLDGTSVVVPGGQELSSRTYRLPLGLIDAFQTGATGDVAAHVKAFQRKQVKPAAEWIELFAVWRANGQRAARDLRGRRRSGSVTIDRRLDLDADTHVPRLTVLVRTDVKLK